MSEQMERQYTPSGLPIPTQAEIFKSDQHKARQRGFTICGVARKCPDCGGNAYGAPAWNWLNRVKCLDCGKEWSQ